MKGFAMRVVQVMASKPSDFTFEVESSTEQSIIDEITDELNVFGFISKAAAPSPRRYPSALRLIGASHYWSNGMVWACVFRKNVKILLVPEKMIKHMDQYEYEDYQKNYDLQNAVIEHFMQIALRKT